MNHPVPLIALCCALPCFGQACDGLSKLSIPKTEVLSATMVTDPASCKVTVMARPVADSEIRIEVWLPPAAQWNGKFVGTGNGGYSGNLSVGDMRLAIQNGYATAGSNTGHDGGDMKFGVGHPEKINDWAYRAVHLMTEVGKQVVQAYYGRPTAQSYFKGCSTGGHQALTEAQRYPADYDGIIAGAPANNRVRQSVAFVWNWVAVNSDPAGPFPASKLAMLNRASVEACDAGDGVRDGVIDDPRKCNFDPGALLCKGGDEATCLTAAQVEAARKIYGGAKNPRTGERLFSGWPRGSEWLGAQQASWAAYFVGHTQPMRTEFWRDWTFNKPDWDPRKFDFDRDVAAGDSKMSFLVSNDTNLHPLQKRKGKILMYHGWSDPVVPPEESIRYYEGVTRTMGGAKKTLPFVRLFLAPGMGHCGGGPGPNTFDTLGTLDKWVTQGVAPDKIIGSHAAGGKVDRTRPLCPYPQIAKWNGSGSSDDAAQFVCTDK